MNANDSEALSKIISDDFFKGVSGEQMNKDAEPQTKAEFIQQVNSAHTISKYYNVRKTLEFYPDAVEYKDENFSGVTWIYSCEYFTGRRGTTGIDYSQPRHTQYVVNKDNQVVFARYYLNQGPYTETQKKSKRIGGWGSIFTSPKHQYC